MSTPNVGLPFAVRIALLLGAALLVSMLRRRVGGGMKRNLIMLAGTLGGMAVGAVVAYPASRLNTLAYVDAVDVCMFVGILIGWALAWPGARRIPPPPAK